MLSKLAADFPMVDDHPDIAGLLRDAATLSFLGDALAEPFRNQGITAVLAPEARGPIFGALVALKLDAGLVLARKNDRNHPGADIPVESAPTWRGEREIFMARSFDLSKSDRVLIVDDWITTGSTLRAAGNIVRLLGATYAGASVLMNKASAETVEELNAHTLFNFDEVMANYNSHPA